MRKLATMIVAVGAAAGVFWVTGWAGALFGVSPPAVDSSILLGGLLAYWTVLQGLVVVVAVGTLVSSIDDLFLDLLYWRSALWKLLTWPWRRPPSQAQLAARFERPIAVMIPAWREAEVIAAMLANTVNTVDYGRYHLFVGVYANDPDTRRQVDRVCQRFPNVHRADVPHDGPTSKADCLNWIVQNILLFEQAAGESFDAFVLQDAEDVVHPFGLKVVNGFLDQAGMLQLPVLSMKRRWYEFVAGHYMDEFAEFHGKDLPVRSALTGVTPSAGVATAFRRDAIDALLADTGGRPFNPASLTEDYEVAQRLHALGVTSRFVRYHARTPRWRKAWFRKGQVRVLRRELVATREYFPNAWEASVRQKSRWMLGISYMGWRRLGWSGSFMDRYFLFRDRKALFTAPLAGLAYLLILHAYGYWLLSATYPSFAYLPPLIAADWVRWLVAANFGFLLSRLLQRAWFTGWTHGLGPALLSPLRIVISNLVAFGAFARSLRLFLAHILLRRPLAWDKTDHQFPSAQALRRDEGRIGDLLRYWNLVTPADLDAAAAAQAERYRPFGLLLLDRGLLQDDDLAEAFAQRAETFAVTVDPEAVAAASAPWPRELGARLGAVPVSLAEGVLDVALAEPLSAKDRRRLEEALGARGVKRVRYLFAPLGDVAFSARFAWEPEAVQALEAAVGAAAGGDAARRADLWRAARRGYARLGDLLVRHGVLDHQDLQTALSEGAGRLGERLVARGLVQAEDVERALQAQAAALDPAALSMAEDKGAPEPA
jgi:adsorption protein B